MEELMDHLPGPDFPTGGFIYGKEGIRQAYETGKGVIQLRARALIERDRKGERENIVITELPYQTNKAKLIERSRNWSRERRSRESPISGTNRIGKGCGSSSN